MKVIFLDIDGVLTSKASAMVQALDRGGLLLMPHPVHVAVLNAIILTVDARVVISSTWRRHYQEMLEELQKAGLKGEILGATPYLPGEQRGTEIQAWLNEHPEVESFVILDDDVDMGDLREYLVKTDTQDGLLATHIPEVFKVFMRTRERSICNEGQDRHS